MLFFEGFDNLIFFSLTHVILESNKRKFLMKFINSMS